MAFDRSRLTDEQRRRIARVKKIMAPVRAALIVGVVALITGMHKGAHHRELVIAHIVLFVGITVERLSIPAWVEGWKTDRRSKGFLALAFMITVALSFGERARHPLVSIDDAWAQSLLAAGIVCIALGLGLRQWAIRTLGPFFTDRARIVEGHQLVTSGPYAWVRHPSYSGLSLIFVGYPLMLASPIGAIACAVLLPLSLRYRLRTEESLLQEYFGTTWSDYAARTPGLIPRPWRRRDLESPARER